jgi:serine protease Do
MELFDHSNEKETWRTLLGLTVLISAIVGAVFGYYGSSLFGSERIQGSLQLGQRLTDEEESDLVISLVKQVSPAVVSIVASRDVQVNNRFLEFCSDPFFRQFFGGCDEAPNQNGTQTQQIAAGSGFIISSDGMVLTNKHVVNIAGADLTVITLDDKKYPAELVAEDPVQDIAILKIGGNNFPSVALGNSDSVLVGQTVIAIGNALGEFNNSVSKGIISGLSRSITATAGNSSERLEKVIQTDAAINPGNSGGPLLNLDGEVIGINTAIVSGAQSIGFAIPINQAKRDVENVQRLGKIVYPYLGIRYVLINDQIQRERNLSVNYGALVLPGSGANEPAVIPGSPAASAGIRENDIVLEIDGQRVTTENTVSKSVQSHKVGDTMRLKILRNGDERTINIVLTERP